MIVAIEIVDSTTLGTNTIAIVFAVRTKIGAVSGCATIVAIEPTTALPTGHDALMFPARMTIISMLSNISQNIVLIISTDSIKITAFVTHPEVMIFMTLLAHGKVVAVYLNVAVTFVSKLTASQKTLPSGIATVLSGNLHSL